jgi:hypothetical protein
MSALAALAGDGGRVLVPVEAFARKNPLQALPSVLVRTGPVDVEHPPKSESASLVAKALGVSDVVGNVRPPVVIEPNTHGGPNQAAPPRVVACPRTATSALTAARLETWTGQRLAINPVPVRITSVPFELSVSLIRVIVASCGRTSSGVVIRCEGEVLYQRNERNCEHW